MLMTTSFGGKPRRLLVAGIALVIFTFIGFRSHNGHSILALPETITENVLAFSRPSNPLLQHHAEFWRHLHALMVQNDPLCVKLPDAVVPINLRTRFDPDIDLVRPDVLWIGEDDLHRLTATHSSFVASLRRTALNLVYVAGARGIAMTASDSLLPILLISLHMIRESNTTLPVEVFLQKPSNTSSAFCKDLFPTLNAKCFYFSEIFEAASTEVKFNSYQYKILSILFSSFEEVLLLDADAFPINNPEYLFTSPQFKSSGLVLWPDFWYTSESPFYFEIAKIGDIPSLNVRAATESGEIVYSKARHYESILLAAYYNFYGPDYYYLLHSQGAPGQGDKETFPWAAKALSEDFYFVKTPVGALGRQDSNGEFIGSAMVQYDPVTEQLQQGRPYQSNGKPLFIHANFPKFDPYTIFNDEVRGVRTPTRDTNGTNVRCWQMSRDRSIQVFGIDLEEKFWHVIQDVACKDLYGISLVREQGVTDVFEREHSLAKDKAVCERVEKYVKEVFG